MARLIPSRFRCGRIVHIDRSTVPGLRPQGLTPWTNYRRQVEGALQVFGVRSVTDVFSTVQPERGNSQKSNTR